MAQRGAARIWAKLGAISVIGVLVAGAVGVATLFVARPTAEPSGSEMLAALGDVLQQEAQRGAQGGGALGARTSFEPPATVIAELIDARSVRSIHSVERIVCRRLTANAFECAYIARGEVGCDGSGCAALGGGGVRPFEEQRAAVFLLVEGRWSARPLKWPELGTETE